MNAQKLLNASYFADLFVKGAIAAAVAIGGWHFRDVAENVKELQDLAAINAPRIAVLEVNNLTLQRQLNNIETKLDRLLDERRNER